ncbi:hypothetical protein [Streptomyces sp. NPDC058045]|uniref:hypothetical protein n=1 Tax=Streptomyces sp. NPDC058045 TaxID=3346311 RepID=UPI0036E9B657
MSTDLTPEAALARLSQYGERTSTWSNAAYNDGTEKALHEIALSLAAEVERLRGELEQVRADLSGRHDDLVEALHACDSSEWDFLVTEAARTHQDANTLRARVAELKAAAWSPEIQRRYRERALQWSAADLLIAAARDRGETELDIDEVAKALGLDDEDDTEAGRAPADGACKRCGEAPAAWCPGCAGCACPDGRAESHLPGGSCPTTPTTGRTAAP